MSFCTHDRSVREVRAQRREQHVASSGRRSAETWLVRLTVRTPAFQAGNEGFDSPTSHHPQIKQKANCFCNGRCMAEPFLYSRHIQRSSNSVARVSACLAESQGFESPLGRHFQEGQERFSLRSSSDQDTRFSPGQQGFESPAEHHIPRLVSSMAERSPVQGRATGSIPVRGAIFIDIQ